MNTVDDLGIILVSAEMLDAVRVGLCAGAMAAKDQSASVQVIESLMIQEGCFLSIRKSLYVMSDLTSFKTDCRYYNINDFMNRICDNLRVYLSEIVNAEIKFESKVDDCENLCFDGKLMEKAIYDLAYGMLWKQGDGKKLIFYAKNDGDNIEIGVKGNFTANRAVKGLTEIDVIYPGAETVLKGESYASIAVKKMGGYVQNKFMKKTTRMELHIPKNLKASENLMMECETAVCGGEAVAVYEVCSRGILRDFFADVNITY